MAAQPQEPRPGIMAEGEAGGVRCQAFAVAAQAAHCSRSTAAGQAIAGNTTITEPQPETLLHHQVGPDRPDDFWIL